MSLIDRQRELAGYLIAGFPEYGLKGWSIKGACASVGNGTEENLCQPVTYGRFDHGSDGIYQWRLNRLTDLKSWTASQGLDWTTIRAQAAFHMYEMQRDYQVLNEQLSSGAKTLETLTANFCDIYERPSVVGRVLDTRIQYARDVYATMQSAASAPLPTPVATGAAGTILIALGGLIHFLQGTPQGPVLSLVATGVIMLVSCLFMRREALPPSVSSKTAEPSVAYGPSVPAALQPVDKLKALLEQRAQIDAQILDLERAVKSSIESMNDLLGQIHPVVIASPTAEPQQVTKEGA